MLVVDLSVEALVLVDMWWLIAFFGVVGAKAVVIMAAWVIHEARLVRKHGPNRRSLAVDKRSVALRWEGSLHILHAGAFVVWCGSIWIEVIGLKAWCNSAALSDVSRGHLSLITLGLVDGDALLIRGTPWLLTVEAGRDAIGATDHLGGRSEQILSWIVEKSIIDIWSTATDNSSWVLREHLSRVAVVDREALLSHYSDMIWTGCRLLRQDSWVIPLLIDARVIEINLTHGVELGIFMELCLHFLD